MTQTLNYPVARKKYSGYLKAVDDLLVSLYDKNRTDEEFIQELKDLATDSQVEPELYVLRQQLYFALNHSKGRKNVKGLIHFHLHAAKLFIQQLSDD